MYPFMYWVGCQHVLITSSNWDGDVRYMSLRFICVNVACSFVGVYMFPQFNW